MTTTFTSTNEKILCLLVAILFSTSSFATKVYNGYLIKNDNEKVVGKIKMISPSLNEVKVKFISIDQKKKTFKAKQVKEYGFWVEKWNKKEKRYASYQVVYVRQKVERSAVPFGPKELLIEREVAGKINVYHHFIERNNNRQQPYLHILYVQKGNKASLVSLDKTNYKEVLREMVAEYPELQLKIGRRGYGFRAISKTIKEYNEWMFLNGEEDFE